MSWALLWAVHVVRWHRAVFPDHPPHVCFNYDACTTAGLAQGFWQAHADVHWKRLMRSFELLLQSYCGKAISWNHVPAHSGHLWNEGVDLLAKFAANHLELGEHPFAPWLTEANTKSLEWMWTIPLGLAPDSQGFVTFPGTPVSVPDLSLDPPVAFSSMQSADRDHEPAWTSRTLQLRFATANVLTLGENHRDATSVVGSRMQTLMAQFQSEHFHIVGIQESRHRAVSMFPNDAFIVLAHSALPSGHEGVQVWFNTVDPFCPALRPFRKQDLFLVFSDPTMIIIRVHHPGLRCLVICCHAPHSARPLDEQHAFWTRLSKHIASAERDLPLVFLGDANAHLGEFVTPSVGSEAPVPENSSGQLFHEWCLTHQVFLPSTFSSMHHGSSITCLYANGSGGARLDYIGLSLQADLRSVRSWISDSIDLSTTRLDHLVACCECLWHVTYRTAPPSTKPPFVLPTFSDPRLIATFQQLWEMRPFLPLAHLDVHAHADALSQHILTVARAATRCLGVRSIRRRKPHISLDTWQLVDCKRWCFRQLRSLRSVQSDYVLRCCFAGWSSSVRQQQLRTACIEHCRALRRCLAWFQWQHDWYSQAAKRALRHEDCAFFANLAAQAGKTYTRSGLQGLWKQIKFLLPKHKGRKAQPFLDHHAEFLRHFEALEFGHTLPEAHLRSQTHRAQQQRRLTEQPFQISLDLLPSVVDVEAQCLRQRPGKASGPDGLPPDLFHFLAPIVAQPLTGLLCRIAIDGTEPHAFKGGRLIALYKGTGARTNPSMHRGILVSNCCAKLFHGWLRTLILPVFLRTRTVGQLGGVPGQQTQTGIHLVNLHSKVARARRVSSAVIFIDLKAAFHSMLREWLFESMDVWTPDHLAAMLGDRDFDLDQMCAALQTHSSVLIDTMPPFVRRLCNDTHLGTWFHLPNLADETFASQVTATGRGTRPGSPLADVCFNLFMAEAIRVISDKIAQIPEVAAGARAADFTMAPIAWVDDVAIPLCAASPDQLIPAVQQTMAIIHDHMNSLGMIINYAKHKTAVALMFRGRGSESLRTQVFGASASQTILVHAKEHIIQLPVVSTYRHLGAVYQMDSTIDVEVKHRLGAARQAFAEVKRQLFLNKHLPQHARMQLFQSLITSRLFYGAGVWMSLTPSHIRQIDAALMRMIRVIVGNGFWDASKCVSDAALRSQFELPSFRVILGKLRLSYLPVLARFPASFYLDALYIDNRNNQGWLHDVLLDLQWMDSVIALPFAIPEVDNQGWDTFLSQLVTCSHWDTLIRRAVYRHVLQEKVAFDTMHMHDQILDELCAQSRVAVCLPPAPEQTSPLDFSCDVCSQRFADRRALAQHRHQAHQLHSAERGFIQSTTCGGCLRNFHSTHRLLQHLKYKPNGCFSKLCHFRTPDSPVNIQVEPSKRHVTRLPCERVLHGPLLPDDIQMNRSRLLTQQWHLSFHDLYPWFSWPWASPPSWTAALQVGLDSLGPPVLGLHDSSSCDAWIDHLLDVIAEATPDHRLGLLFAFHWIDHLLPATFSNRPSPSLLDSASIGDRALWQFWLDIEDVQSLWELRRHRRTGDFQWWVQGFLASAHPGVICISIDTAIASQYNILNPSLWNFLMNAAAQGAIVALVCGPPCETWSHARALPLHNEHGVELRGPRPLRDRQCPWGLSRLFGKELVQLHIGTILLLRAIHLAVRAVHFGTRIVIEHPDIPWAEDGASIWHTSLIRFLIDSCALFRTMTIQQYRFGSPAIKPTRLLYANLPLENLLRRFERPDLPRPTRVLAGRRSDGTFATAGANSTLAF
eukprot:Skav200697  [mRNA]  locus=scaffold343:224008:229565:- [translate_table: standard]